MKKTLFLSILVVLTISLNGQTPWYYRQYGVNNINDLSEEMLKEALQDAENKVKTGPILTFVGIGTTVVGGILYAHAMSFDGTILDELRQIGPGTSGVLLMIAGSGIIAIGVPFWIIGADRKNSIEVALVKFKPTSFSGYNEPTYLGSTKSEPFGLSLKIYF
jgi:hypothetical protein